MSEVVIQPSRLTTPLSKTEILVPSFISQGLLVYSLNFVLSRKQLLILMGVFFVSQIGSNLTFSELLRNLRKKII